MSRQINLKARPSEKRRAGGIFSFCCIPIAFTFIRQSCLAAADEALAIQSLPPAVASHRRSSSTGSTGSTASGMSGAAALLMSSSSSSQQQQQSPHGHRAKALYWRARARAQGAERMAAASPWSSDEHAEAAAAAAAATTTTHHRHYVLTCALKDLAEAVRIEPGDRAIR